MDVIGFLCVSLGSSRVQLYDSIRKIRSYIFSEARFSSQNGDRAWGIYYRGAAFCCVFFVGKRTEKDIHKEMFHVYGGKCVTRFTTGSRNSLQDVRKSQMMKRRCGSGWDKRLLRCGFRRTGKAMGQVYQCWWRICREINVFSSRFEYRMFYVLYSFVTYLLTILVRQYVQRGPKTVNTVQRAKHLLT
jgi:hypothetical protein